MRYSAKQLQGADLVLLCSLDIRGRVFRFASYPVSIANSDSESGPSLLQYRGGLAEDTVFEDRSELGDTLIGRSVGIAIDFSDDDGSSWGVFAENSADLGDASCELAIIRTGDDYTSRMILIKGKVTAPTYGSRFEPLVFTIEDSLLEADNTIPDERAIVDDVSWKSGTRGTDTVMRDPNTDGAAYPVVFGRPGNIGGANITDLAGLPALQVELDDIHRANNVSGVARAAAGILISGHWTAATSVRLYNFSQKAKGSPSLAAYKYTDVFDVIKTIDKRGRQVSKLLVPGTGTPSLICNEGDALFVSFGEGAGGLLDPSTGAEMRGAGQIIHYLLQSTGQIPLSDEAGISLSRLDSYTLDLYVNEPTRPVEIIAQEIAPLLPVSVVSGPGGVEIVVWTVDPGMDSAVGVIDPSIRGGQRASGVSFSDSYGIVNEPTIYFSRDANSGKYKRSITYSTERAFSASPTSPGVEDSTLEANPYSGASVRRYGARKSEPIRASCVQDPATARAILDWMIRYYGQSRRKCTYLLPQDYQYLRPGDVVIWRDADLGIADTLSHVISVTRAPGQTLITLESIPNWIGEV